MAKKPWPRNRSVRSGGPPRANADDGSYSWSKWLEDGRDAEKEQVYDHPEDDPRDRPPR